MVLQQNLIKNVNKYSIIISTYYDKITIWFILDNNIYLKEKYFFMYVLLCLFCLLNECINRQKQQEYFKYEHLLIL